MKNLELEEMEPATMKTDGLYGRRREVFHEESERKLDLLERWERLAVEET